MGKNPKSIEITDPENGEVFSLNAESLVNDTIGVLMSWRRNVIQSMVWEQLSEDQQNEAIGNAESLATDLVTGLVEIIATGGNDVIHALLDNFKIKDGTVTVTAKGLADDAALLALNSVGKKALKIVVADAEKFDQEGDRPEPMADQPELEMGDDTGPGMTEQDVEDMAAEMDADLDGMEEPDDLHEEDSDTPAAEVSDLQVEGHHARMQGLHSQRNPYDPDAPEVEDPAPKQDPKPTPEGSPLEAGQQARVRGDGPDENPFDGGTPEYESWADGYAGADAEISALVEAGEKAARAGESKESCPWKKGTDGERFWLQGYDQGEKQA